MVIYKTTNIINKKIYIGMDTNNNPKYLGSGVVLKQAINKHGKENFTKEILEKCNTLEKLKKQEKYWILKLNSRDRKIGYNLTDGGDGVINPSEYTRNKMRSAKIGKKLTLNHKNNIRKNARNNPNYGMTGKKHSREFCLKNSISHKKKNLSEETITKMRIAKLGKPGNRKGKKCTKETILKLSKTVIQFDNNGKFIKEWESATVACKNTGVSYSTISIVCSGKRKRAGGFIWKYKNFN